MPKINPTYDLKITCQRCDAKLRGNWIAYPLGGSKERLKVAPCDYCLDVATNAGRKEAADDA